MSFDYIQKAYGVPAKKGARVEYTGDHEPRLGTIVSETGAHVNIRLDGDKRVTGPYHPTWELRYLNEAEPSPVSDVQDFEIPF